MKTYVKCWKYRPTAVTASVNHLFTSVLPCHSSQLYWKFLALKHLGIRHTTCCCKLVLSTALACNCGWWWPIWTDCSCCKLPLSDNGSFYCTVHMHQQTHHCTSYTPVYFMLNWKNCSAWQMDSLQITEMCNALCKECTVCSVHATK